MATNIFLVAKHKLNPKIELEVYCYCYLQENQKAHINIQACELFSLKIIFG